jgi:hypothetical protein
MQSFFRETPCIREGRDVVETTDSRIKPASMSAIATYISKAVSAVASDEELRLIPGTFDEVVAAPRQLQKLLTRLLHKADLAALRGQLSLAEQSHLKSCAQRGASLLFQVIPSEPRLQVNNDEFSHALTLHLGCPLLAKFSAEQASKCKSCGFTKDPVLAPQHICNCGTGGGPQRRHDMLRDVFVHMFRSAHLPTRQEVRAELPHTGNGGPDVLVSDFPLPGQTTMFDVSVINPVQKQFFPRAASVGLVAAASRAKDKLASYAKTAGATGYRAVPLVFETTGAFGPEVLDCLTSFNTIYESKFGKGHSPSASAVHPATIPSVYWKQVLATTHAKGTYAMFRAILSAAGRKPATRSQ